MKDLIEYARGTWPAKILLTNARAVNVFTGEIETANIALATGWIVGVGDYTEGEEVIDLEGAYVYPALINGHIHPESSMLHPVTYAETVVPRGVGGIVTDLHEIANVAGLKGIRWMLDAWKYLPLEVYFMVPSCVPATDLETAGARIGNRQMIDAYGWDETTGIGEVMNFPGVINCVGDVLGKLYLGKGTIDGHAPGLSGRDLNAYIAAGIDSDHECTRLEEAREKLARGMYIMIREGSSEKNLETLLPLVNDATWPRCLFVVDDRNCTDLGTDGDIDAVVRTAIELGLDPIRAIQMATITPARRFRLSGQGAIAPGYCAHLAVTHDLETLIPHLVFHSGRVVARDGEACFRELPEEIDDAPMRRFMSVAPFTVEDLAIPAENRYHPVIGIIPGQIVTEKRELEPLIENGQVVPDLDRDLLKLIVVERHQGTGNIGKGLVQGVGLKRGALATSVGHDSHNIIAVGTTDADLYAAVKEVERLGGGLVAMADGEPLAALPLPLAGLLSDQPLEVVTDQHKQVEAAARELGAGLDAPFDTLSFLALPVIPELKLTDRGLVDVTAFRLLD